jgi:hypothetical protein
MNTQRTAGAVLATLTALMLGACSDDSTSSTGEPSSAPSGASSAEPSSAGPSTPDDTLGYNILGPSTRTNLNPGRWAVTAAGSRDVPLAVVDLPERFNGGGEYIWSVGGAAENDGWIIGYWTVGGVHVDPCTRAGGTFETEHFPDLWVEALAAQRRTTTSRAVPVTLDGHHGLYVELSLPTHLDYSTCRGNGLAIFDVSTKGDVHLIDTPGVVERYWVLDLDGERVVLVGMLLPGTTDSQADQLTEIIESVQFER